MRDGLSPSHSTHFDKTISSLDARKYCRQDWHQPPQQNGIGGIADPQPDHNGWNLVAEAALRKVLILGQDCRVILQGVFPYRGIPGVPQPYFTNRHRIASRLPQCSSQRRRKLGINDELHAACSTA